MNVCGIAGNYVHPSQRDAFGADRVAAWAPGGALARELADDCLCAAIVGDSCFVHAHLPADATEKSLGALNRAAKRWLRGEPCEDDDVCTLTEERLNRWVSQHPPPMEGAERLPYPLSPYFRPRGYSADGSRRRRGYDVVIPWKIAATHGYDVEIP